VIQARATGEGCQLEIAQSDAAAAMDWLRSETWKAYERPQSEVTGNEADNYERRAPGTAGMEDGVRYQFYATTDGHVLFMASEREFWKNFCAGVDRLDLFERWPGSQYGDHARGNAELREILRDIFATRSSEEWLAFGLEHNTPIAPANTPRTLLDDPQFRDRFPLIPASRVGADMLPTPLKFVDETLPEPTRAPTVGQHTDEVLREYLGWEDEDIARAREAGAFGSTKP
jgi:crotonobetainyl-CoA:carnitine CoA-transferase CaiB-like acyl-CoA transferase